jgi:hypothetical protein
MTTSNTVKDIQTALIEARAEIENLNPSAKGYSYTYVPLEKVIDHLKEILPKHGLGYIQLPSGGSGETVGLSTRIIHSSGEWIEDMATFKITDMKGVNVSQASGSAITYFRRYALCAAFGITGDEDCDADPTHGKKPADITPEPKKTDAPPTDTPEYITLKTSLIDWLAVEPKLLTDAQRTWVEARITAKDIQNMKLAIDKFKAASAEARK